MKSLIGPWICSLILLSAPRAFAVSIEEVAEAAKAANFEEKTFPKTGDIYSVNKTISKKRFSNFKAFPKSKTTAAIDQIALSCNQCDSKKLTEAASIACYEDVQAIALKLKLDLPGAIIKAFEDTKTQQQSWDGKDKLTKVYRYTKTKVKCEKPSKTTEGIRFDIFFK